MNTKGKPLATFTIAPALICELVVLFWLPPILAVGLSVHLAFALLILYKVIKAV